MSWIWTVFLGISTLCAVLTGRGTSLAAAIPEGAGSGITLSVSLAGSMCLWCGVGALMEKTGVTGLLAKLLGPLLKRLFPSAQRDPALARDLSANVCANLLGLGNAATPMGISAARRLKRGDAATDELCRLVVLNTASIQLIPTTVAAVRSGLGARDPFGILPAVWVSSLISAGTGLVIAWVLGRLWKK